MELLRLATAGSVDDGKSTLIGRLLYDSKAIFEDQLDAVERTSRERGDEYTNLALLTDGLRAEREQGITIDVAYRYFATPRRKFIIADTPGHTQYTRNMVTGASTADLALILIDARKGVLEQSRRHAFLSSLLGIPHLVLCVNKMDLVDWSQERFEEIKGEFRDFAARLDVHDLTFVPISALTGDNVVHRSEKMGWYEGAPLLSHLEDVHIASDRNLVDARFPVQYVIRPIGDEHHDYRGYAGTVAGGVFRPGDDIVVLPSGRRSRIASIDSFEGPLPEAFPPMAVTITLADQVDISRGDLLARPNNSPKVTSEFEATVAWMSEADALKAGSTYVLKHTTRTVRATVAQLRYRLDINTLHRDGDAAELTLNEIGRVRIRTTEPLMIDEYRRNRSTGSFILIDTVTNRTVGAGMILPTTAPAPDAASGSGSGSASADVATASPAEKSTNVVWHHGVVSREQRFEALDAIGATIWFTGLSGSGKSTVAAELERRLLEAGQAAFVLDGDNLRHGLNADLGFGAGDRDENVRRTAEVARLMAEAGVVSLVSLISPYRAMRDRARAIHKAAGLPFIEVFVDTPIEECERRDVKGLYAKARAGEITGFTGVDDPYETPTNADIVLRPSDGDAAEQARLVLADLLRRTRDLSN